MANDLDAAQPPPYKAPMDIRRLTDHYAVSPQIDPSDMDEIASLGFHTIINNRPCGEVPPSHQRDAMRDAAKAAGLEIVDLPVTHATLSVALADQQKDVCTKAEGPVLAYCASGTRSTIVWAIGQAGVGDLDTDTIVEKAAAHGYDLSALRSQLEAIATQRNG